MKIISLVPSLTELLFELGLGSEIVGITKFCIHPSSKPPHVTKVGGTKTLKIEKIKSLHPDLIIANKEENTKEQIQQLINLGYQILLTDINTLKEALDAIWEIAKKTNSTSRGAQLILEITTAFQSLNTDLFKNKSVLYFIWQKPYMIASNQTFIHDLLKRIGLINVGAQVAPRYPELSVSQITKLNPSYIFLSSEPFPFSESHLAEFQKLFPLSKIVCVDGEMFSWYGSRLKYFPSYIRKLHQQLG